MAYARAKQVGAVYVEAAIVLPVIILVTFASLFFFLCAARQFTVQMLATEIAKDISIALRPAVRTGIDYCINECRIAIEGGAQGANPFLTKSELDLDAYHTAMYTNSSPGCWRTCAQNAYLLGTTGTYPLKITLRAHHMIEFYDDPLLGTQNYNDLSPGDIFTVTLQYPLRAVWGGGIAMFGVVPEGKFLTGIAVGVLEKGSRTER